MCMDCCSDELRRDRRANDASARVAAVGCTCVEKVAVSDGVHGAEKIGDADEIANALVMICSQTGSKRYDGVVTTFRWRFDGGGSDVRFAFRNDGRQYKWCSLCFSRTTNKGGIRTQTDKLLSEDQDNFATKSNGLPH